MAAAFLSASLLSLSAAALSAWPLSFSAAAAAAWAAALSVPFAFASAIESAVRAAMVAEGAVTRNDVSPSSICCCGAPKASSSRKWRQPSPAGFSGSRTSSDPTRASGGLSVQTYAARDVATVALASGAPPPTARATIVAPTRR